MSAALFLQGDFFIVLDFKVNRDWVVVRLPFFRFKYLSSLFSCMLPFGTIHFIASFFDALIDCLYFCACSYSILIF
jgi:hypothetical protein